MRQREGGEKAERRRRESGKKAENARELLLSLIQ